MMRWWEGAMYTFFSGVLLVCANSLNDQLRSVSYHVVAEERMARREEKLVITSLAGIGVSGEPVLATLPPLAQRVVACGLRDNSFHQDIAIWSAVAGMATIESSVHIAAYCLGPECVQHAREKFHHPALTIVTHGNVTTSQVVATDDARGECAILDSSLKKIRQFQWRTPSQHVADLAAEVVR